MNTLKLTLIIFVLAFGNYNSLYAEDEHNEATQSQEEKGHEEEGGVHLTAAQRNAADIQTTTLNLQSVRSEVIAPGETALNGYATSQVSPRITAQVMQRHAKLGDSVSAGQALVTLSSVEMSQAQGDILVSAREWRRVKKLGRKVVSEARHTQAKVNHEQARAKVMAYGMSQLQLNTLLKSGKAELANGRFQLMALQDGTVIHDDFILGELVKAGRVLFEISDESTLWVDARLTPDQAIQIQPGAMANIRFRDQQLSGKVIQIHHALDENTRTLGVRIEVPNPDDLLHPGLFVDARITANSNEQALAVPSDAVLRSPDGDWIVFIEHDDNEFEPQEVEVVRSSGGLTVVEGLAAGSRVVTHGAFFLQSELAKSGFSIHNH